MEVDQSRRLHQVADEMTKWAAVGSWTRLTTKNGLESCHGQVLLTRMETLFRDKTNRNIAFSISWSLNHCHGENAEKHIEKKFHHESMTRTGFQNQSNELISLQAHQVMAAKTHY
jgi:hypothetical protein